ncbi:MAG: ACP S-malonyltransferase [Synergistaceae bacterium]|jgi:[acyl-carrier-protein] S-malonyltransferase|nr:ACP S-malonyltransferase [Synergistaceae bacterium]
MSYAIVFPGQGAQEVGMGKDFYEGYDVARKVFDEADEALGFSLSKVMFEGPEDELVKTAITQPAILAASIAVAKAVEFELQKSGKNLEPAFYAGHSLGEYTALAASGVISLDDALRLVHKRGELMQNAVPLGQGAMSAILGLDLALIDEICKEAGGVCSAANVNAPVQIVISGEANSVSRAGDIARARGATRVIPLKVSAPFHCELMRPVADQLREEFSHVKWSAPHVPIVANVDSSTLKSVEAIQNALYRQTYSPVMWEDGARAMESAGVDLFLELGPGNVLTGLIKRICKGKKTVALNKAADMAKAIEALGTAGGAVS